MEKIKTKYQENITFLFGKGLIAAIIFKSSKENYSDSSFTSKIVEKCYQKGLLVVHTGRESIKIGPPLTIPVEALKEGIKIIDESIAEVLLE